MTSDGQAIGTGCMYPASIDTLYDYSLNDKLQLTAQEVRGQKLFDDPAGGNCASCPIDQKGVDGSHPLFTDFNFQALGVPRNPGLKANADHRYFDMGLCEPVRTDQSKEKTNCGLFRSVSLRNKATRHVFFPHWPLPHAEGRVAWQYRHDR